MRNPYVKNLSKIEFVVTDACTGRCKHCSEGEHSLCGDRIDADACALAVRKIASEYDIQTVMTFGGEPLLHPDAVFSIMRAAKELQIPRRQVITNGYFTKDAARMREMASMLSSCGVNDLLLSVDAFHEETIPLAAVRRFAVLLLAHGVPTRLQPAWLKGEAHDNPYNAETRRILAQLADLGIPVGAGNTVFPEGNAMRYLAEYFEDDLPPNPYVEDDFDVRCISFAANGDVLNSNFYRRDIMEIIENYAP